MQLLLIILLSLSSAFADNIETDTIWYENNTIHLYFFWSPYCPHCQKAHPFIEYLQKKYDWLTIHSYDVVNSQDSVDTYITLAKLVNENAQSVPSFIFCNQMMTGFDNALGIGAKLEQKLVECYQRVETQQEILEEKAEKPNEYYNLPIIGKLNPETSLLLNTFIIAALDAFNPCAFFILFFLLSLLIHAHSRFKMLFIGGVFVFFSGFMYFIFMAAWLNLFLITQEIKIITSIAAVTAIIIALINIKDFFFFKQGVSLNIPEQAKPGLFKRMRNLLHTKNIFILSIATIILAIVANSYELICTAGFPMVYTRILTLGELSTLQYYLYLILYNIIYVIPLFIIVIFFGFTMNAKKITEAQGQILKLLSGLMMLGLGFILLFMPEALSNMWISAAILTIAILSTIALIILKKIIHKTNDKP